jgi:hypothetical protein
MPWAAMYESVRQTSNSTTTGPITAREAKATITRQALSEVTIAAVNRAKVINFWTVYNGII